MHYDRREIISKRKEDYGRIQFKIQNITSDDDGDIVCELSYQDDDHVTRINVKTFKLLVTCM